ncbi:MAG: tetratricopeptide repeat protein [Pseudohongiellaceae bacterium]
MTAFNGCMRVLFCLVLAVAVVPVSAGSAAPGGETGVEAVRERLAELRRERGVYDPALIEAWSDLAAQQADNGDHEQAADSWHEALQISRISDGLYDTSQLRIIEQLAMAYEEAGETEEADTYHYLLFHTRSRLHAPDSPESVDAVIDWGDWKLRRSTARNGNLNPGALSGAELESLWSQQADAMEVLRSWQDDSGRVPDDVRFGSLLYLRAVTELGMAILVLQRPAHLFDPPLTQQYVTQRVCRNVSDPSGGTRQECSTRQVENPQYRRAQVAERSQQAERAIRAARQTLSELTEWQGNAPEEAVKSDELETLNRALTRLEQNARRSRFRRW